MFALYSAIWRVSGPRQIILILLSISIAALAAVPLNYQKDIINALTSATTDIAGLVKMCGQMFAFILLSLGLKWLLGYRSSLLGEDVIRFIRTRVYDLNTDPEGHESERIGSGTLTTVISAEAEEVGKFTGSSFSEPVVQIGTLVAVVGFIASTQPGLGAIALAMIIPQVFIVLGTQRQVNRLVEERVRILRGTSDRIDADVAESIKQSVLDDFDRIYTTRRRMFIWKLSTKFVLSAINGAATVAVLLLGGMLVLEGRTDVGTVVAATLGLSRLQGPTAFLIAFYRQVSATRVKFDLLREVANTQPDQT